MWTLVIALGSLVFYIVAYHTYGRWLAQRFFRLDPHAGVPSRVINDGQDYVPTRREVIFGHHFTSIAGTGPIVGPALAVIWGWLPALLWVLLGSVFMGAVHDFGSLVVSLRSRGQTIGDVAGRLLNPRVRILFLAVLFLIITIVLAIFGLVIANIFAMYPSSVLSVWLGIPLAVAVGYLVYRRGWSPHLPAGISLIVMVGAVVLAALVPSFQFTLQPWHVGDITISPVVIWTVLLLLYCYVASTLPVWRLLQPRDYINSYQLVLCLFLLVVGIAATCFLREGGAPIIAPAMRTDPAGAPPLMPFLFITIACGAISGFHSLVSSGTSSKQLASEPDALFVGYGSMLTEGFLAVLVILACCAGIGLTQEGSAVGSLSGEVAWMARYETWSTAQGLPAKVGAFVNGGGNFLTALGIPLEVAIGLMAVLVASFAATTLDTAMRLQRYVIQELSSASNFKPFKPLTGKYGATSAALIVAAIVAALPPPGHTWATGMGKGGLILWPLLGATNQLLAGLAFLVIAFYLARRKMPTWMVTLPMIAMIVLPFWAMLLQLFGEEGWLKTQQYHLVVMGVIVLALEVWMLVEAVRLWPRIKGVLEPGLPALDSRGAMARSSSSDDRCHGHASRSSLQQDKMAG